MLLLLLLLACLLILLVDGALLRDLYEKRAQVNATSSMMTAAV
jgi:hypothetical protein